MASLELTSWGFGAGFTDGEVMLGGTYHNGTLIKDNEVYENGWLCAEGGDNYRGFVNFADSRKFIQMPEGESYREIEPKN